MKQRMIISVAGAFHNLSNGVQKGDIVELDNEYALKYRHLGYTEDLDSAELTPDQRKARTDEAKQAWESHAKRLAEQVEHQRHAARNHTLDAGTGLPIDHTRKGKIR